MNNCLLCGQLFVPPLSVSNLFTWHKQSPALLCRSCRAQFKPLPQRRCQVCAGKLPIAAPEEKICPDCRRWQQIYGTQLLFNDALYLYTPAVHDLMVNYKRAGDYLLRLVLQDLCRDYFTKATADYFVPIPTSPEHFAQRQFDTVNAIYASLVPLTPLLHKKEGTSAQGEKNRQQRLKSPQSFLVKAEQRADLNHYQIILLDDIYTTGRTLYHARDALLEIYPQACIKSFTIYR